MFCFHRMQRVLADSKEEVEALVKNYTSPSKLATFVIAMKRCGLTAVCVYVVSAWSVT